METKFKCFGVPLSFPLPMDGDWVRIQCGVDGEPNYIFGVEGVKEFYEDGAGIYSQYNGKPTNTLEYWLMWYENEKDERIRSYSLIQDIKQLINK